MSNKRLVDFDFAGFTEASAGEQAIDEVTPEILATEDLDAVRLKHELWRARQRLEHELLESREEGAQRRRIGLFIVALTVLGIPVGIVYGAVTKDYSPLKEWLSYLGPWAGYVLRMLFEGKGGPGAAPPPRAGPT